MIGILGLNLAGLTCFLAAVFYFRSLKGSKKYRGYGRACFCLSSFCILCSSAYLFYLLGVQDFCYLYVYEHGALPLDPASFYAGKEGSYLFWALISSLLGLCLILYSRKKNGLESRMLLGISLIQLFILLGLSSGMQNPFRLLGSKEIYISIENIKPEYATRGIVSSSLYRDPTGGDAYLRLGPETLSVLKENGIAVSQIIKDGKAINPALNSFWMKIHPPLLFAGFVLTEGMFVLCLLMLFFNESKYLLILKRISILSLFFLGGSIVSGAYWAYTSLGWGGYWNWDPVENTSLIPVLLILCFIHMPGKYPRTKLAFAGLPFIMVLFSTGLTRTGLLGHSSQHSFGPDAGLIWYFAAGICISSMLLILAICKSKPPLAEHKFKTNSVLSLIFSFLLVGSSAVLLFGTIAPLIGTRLGEDFFSSFHLPLALICILLVFMLLFFAESRRRMKRTGFALIHLSFVLFLAGILMSSCFSRTFNFSIDPVQYWRGALNSSGGSEYAARLNIKGYSPRIKFRSSGERIPVPDGQPMPLRFFPELSITHEAFQDLYLSPVESADTKLRYRLETKPFIMLFWAGSILMLSGMIICLTGKSKKS